MLVVRSSFLYSWKEEKSHETIPGEYNGCSVITLLFLVKYSGQYNHNRRKSKEEFEYHIILDVFSVLAYVGDAIEASVP